MSDPIKVAIVEDDEVIRDGLAVLLETNEDYCCSGTYPDCSCLLKDLPANLPDVVLMDIELPGMSGIEGTRKVRRRYPEVDILILTVHENDELVFDALCAGACGYLTKNEKPARLLESIKDVCSGGAPMSTNIARMVVRSFQKSHSTPLTPRETEVLNYLALGKSYRMIADQLYIDKETVRTHIKNIYQKLEVHSKSEAIEKALRDKLI